GIAVVAEQGPAGNAQCRVVKHAVAVPDCHRAAVSAPAPSCGRRARGHTPAHASTPHRARVAPAPPRTPPDGAGPTTRRRQAARPLALAPRTGRFAPRRRPL